MDSPLIPDVEQKHVEIDALIPIHLHANLNELFHKNLIHRNKERSRECKV